jgi:hypothetical protein
MRQDWNLEFRLLESALQVRDYVQLSHRPKNLQRHSQTSKPIQVNPSWELALREAMQPTG